MFCLHENDIWSYFGKHWKKRFYPSCCKSQDSAGDFCIILRVAKQVGTEKKRTVFCYLSVVSTPEAASPRLPAHPQNCTDFALRVLAFTFISLTEKIDTTTPGGKLMGALAEFE